MFWFTPVWFLPNQNLLPSYSLPAEQIQQPQPQMSSSTPPNITNSHQQEVFLELLIKNLKKKNSKNLRKVWTQEQDQILLKERQQGKQWEEIALKIEAGTAQNCERRFNRVKKFLSKWPKEVDIQIVRLFQTERLTWNQINQKIQGYSEKQIKDRYLNYLRPGIDKSKWSIEEDLKLVKLVESNGGKWRKIVKQFENRSELQVKNRYCRTIAPSMQKVRKLLKRQPRLWRNRN